MNTNDFTQWADYEIVWANGKWNHASQQENVFSIYCWWGCGVIVIKQDVMYAAPKLLDVWTMRAKNFVSANLMRLAESVRLAVVAWLNSMKSQETTEPCDLRERETEVPFLVKRFLALQKLYEIFSREVYVLIQKQADTYLTNVLWNVLLIIICKKKNKTKPHDSRFS